MKYSVLIAGFAAASSAVARSLPTRDTAFGSCTNPGIIFADGLDGRNTAAFEPANESDFNHGSALGIAVITSFICQQLNDKCKASAAQIANCNAGATAAAALTGQAAADAFNAALGLSVTTTDTASTTTTADTSTATTCDAGVATETVMVTVTSTPAAATTTGPANLAAVSTCPPASTVTATVTVSAGGASTTTTTDAAAATTATTVSAAIPPASNAAPLNFGTCTDPTIIFAAGLPGRKATEFAFEPHNLAEFNHGTALNPIIIVDFICNTFVNNCGLKQTDEVFTLCKGLEPQLTTLGHTGLAADTFNLAMGFVTNFAALDSTATTTTGKKREWKRKLDPRVPLKEMTQFARRHGFSPARYIK